MAGEEGSEQAGPLKMVTPEEIDAAVEVLKSFGARRIVLFGSAVDRPETANDLDIACEGVPDRSFYSAAGALITRLKRNVDLVDLKDNERRSAFIEKTGRLLYAV